VKPSLHLLKYCWVFLQSLAIFIGPLALGPQNNTFAQVSPKSQERLDHHPEIQDYYSQITELDNALTNGDSSGLDLDDLDSFHFRGQFAEVPNSQSEAAWVNLNSPHIELKQIISTHTLIEYDQEKRRLIFKGFVDDNIKAQHIIEDIDLVTYKYDKEFFCYMDSKGQIHGIDLSFAMQDALYRTPIPIFRKLYVPKSQIDLLAGEEIKMEFSNPGLKPFPEENPTHKDHYKILLARDENGKYVRRAGDVVIYAQNINDGRRRLIAVHPRARLYHKIKLGARYLAEMLHLYDLSASPERLKQLHQEIDQEADNNPKATEDLEEFDNIKRLLAHEKSDPIAQSMLAYPPGIFKKLKTRAEQMQKLSERQFDLSSFDEAQKTYQDLRERAERRQNRLKKELAKARKNKKAKIQAQINSLQDQIDKENLGPSWIRLVSDHSLANKQEQKNWQERIRERGSSMLNFFKFSKRSFLNVSKAIALGGLGVVASEVYDPGSVMRLMNWAYHNIIYPPVLQDAAYRMPLLKSIAFSTLQFMIGVPLLAYLSVPLMRGSAALSAATANFVKKLGSSSPIMRLSTHGSVALYASGLWLSERSQALKKTAKKYAPLGPFARLVNFGMRIYAPQMLLFFFPLMDRFIKKRAGYFNNKLEKKLRSQYRIKLLAILLASEEENIDPSTLIQNLNGAITRERLNEAFENPETLREWQHISYGLSRELKSFKFLEEVDLDTIDTEEVMLLYERARKKASKIKSFSAWRKKLWDKKVAFKSLLIEKTDAFLNFGRKDHQRLKTLMANPFVVGQKVKDYITDQGMMLMITALYGKRADLDNPDELFAMADHYGGINPEMLFQFSLGVYGHFSPSASRLALIYQPDAESEDLNYSPKEHHHLDVDKEGESFWNASKAWVAGVANPLRADLGGDLMKTLRARIILIQAGLSSTIFFRYLFGQSPKDSTMVFFLALVMATWIYGFPMLPGRRGNLNYEKRIAANEKAIKSALTKFAQDSKLQHSSSLSQSMQNLIDLFFEKGQGRWLELFKDAEKITGVAPQDRRAHSVSTKIIGALDADFLKLMSELEALVVKNKDNIIKSKRYEIKYKYEEIMRKIDNEGSKAVDENKIFNEAEDFIAYMQEQPPLPGKENKVFLWSVMFALSITVTYLAIPFGILKWESFEVMKEAMLKWIPISVVLHIAFYLLLSKRSWMAINKRLKLFDDPKDLPSQKTIPNANLRYCEESITR